ncbi:Chaperone protein dnaJ 1 [Nostocoides japonicum T1-X7]|uniref:Chaperone protein dnaJ 1 n=1 Tax=Nostocoides japonicum T1-X7 TaxID=1194083 RepID=A0A077LZZ8_9MICO|nr:DnaJ C-terminal domain-containing protein [Tetrasphaera japonica]CCH79583.1 Chaperone protein dnaJ 1 [Tetrasphaera japonica T1-X7]
MASQDWFEKDFYAILGVPQDADDAAIKKAYRKLARKLHPDQNPGDAAAEQRFKDVGEAYAVLSDPEERHEYDAVRQMARGGARFTAGGPGGGNGGFEDIFSAFGGGRGGNVRFSTGGTGFRGSGGAGGAGGQADINDILSQMFGGGGGGTAYGGGDPFSGYGAPAGPRKGQDVTARTSLSFRDAVEGATVTLQTPEGRSITTRIPAGVKDGQKIRLRGKGAPGDAGAPSGDLILTVTVDKHPVFGRDGDNLTVDLPVTFAEATLGATVRVPTLNGGSVRVKVAPGTPSGRVLRVKGRGVKTSSHTGDLLAKVNVVVPQRLSGEAREAVEALRKQEGDYDPRAELFAKAGE